MTDVPESPLVRGERKTEEAGATAERDVVVVQADPHQPDDSNVQAVGDTADERSSVQSSHELTEPAVIESEETDHQPAEQHETADEVAETLSGVDPDFSSLDELDRALEDDLNEQEDETDAEETSAALIDVLKQESEPAGPVTSTPLPEKTVASGPAEHLTESSMMSSINPEGVAANEDEHAAALANEKSLEFGPSNWQQSRENGDEHIDEDYGDTNRR